MTNKNCQCPNPEVAFDNGLEWCEICELDVDIDTDPALDCGDTRTDAAFWIL